MSAPPHAGTTCDRASCARLAAMLLPAALAGCAFHGFGGRVVDPSGTGVPAARVEVNGEATVSDASGRFSLPVPQSKQRRYLLNVRKTGYGLLSRIYDRRVRSGRWILTPGTVRTFAPGEPIELSDSADPGGCASPFLAHVNWSADPRRALPRLQDTFGQLAGGGLPAEARAALSLIFGGTACSPGASLSIPRGDLVDADGAPPKEPVTVTLATVDRFAPFSMPGDGTVSTPAGDARLETFGAVTVLLESAGRDYQPAPGAPARLELPLHPGLAKSAPGEIPFLVYDEATGAWLPEASAKLDPARGAWVAEIPHFTAFNTDLVKDEPACLRIDAAALGGDSFGVDLFMPVGGSTEYRFFDMHPDTDQGNAQLHAIYNLPANAWVTLVATREADAGTELIGVHVVNTGAPAPPGIPNRPEYPYPYCLNQVTLEPPGPVEATLLGSAGNAPENLRPFHIYSLVRGSDIYPVGERALYTFALFDTGADLIVLPTVEAEFLGMIGPGLGPELLDVDLRVSGLGAVQVVTNDDGTLSFPAPIGPPGADDAAELQVPDLRVAAPPPAPLVLLGAPLANAAVARIDPRTAVERGPYQFCNCSFTGMDLEFLDPAAAPLPEPALNLPLERFGEPGTSPVGGATVGQRYFLRQVILAHGDARVSDIASERRFLFDTGTLATIISVEVAGALGLDLDSPGAHDCWEDVPGAEGYLLDAVEVVDRDDPERVFRAAPVLACVDREDNKIVITHSAGGGPPRKVDAVIGMHLLEDFALLFDGPGDRLGVGLPEP